jgi:predicted Ser/Thr protein kinase
VWHAVDDVLARPVAIKVLRADLAGDSAFSERFQTEAVAAARLTHPNIVSIFDTGLDDGVHYIVMEYFRGQTLLDVMDAEKPMDPDRAVDLVISVLTALAFAHSMGVLHRDVKPANILVGTDGRVKVTDFGIAKAAFAEHDLTKTGAMLGTVRYVSPEQVEEAPLDARSDVYSVGVVLYELLTGRPPFSAASDVATALMRLTQDPPSPRAIRPVLRRPLEAIVLRAMARRREDRFASADAMRAALERLQAGGEATPPKGIPTAPGAVPRGVGAFRSWMLVPLLVLLTAAAAIVAGLLLAGVVKTKASPSPRASNTGGGKPALHAVTIAHARDFDPQGRDRSEHPESASLAIDGESSTAWMTDHYDTAAFGSLKSGLGLWLDLGRTVPVRRVTIRTLIPGWTFELRPGAYGDPGDPIHGTNGQTAFTIDSGAITVGVDRTRASGLLIWITQLGPDGGRFAASVADVTVSA